MTQRVSWREHCHGRIQRVEQNINTRRFHAWTGPPTIPSAVRKTIACASLSTSSPRQSNHDPFAR